MPKASSQPEAVEVAGPAALAPGRRSNGANDVKEVGVEGSRVCRVPGCIRATRGLVMHGSG